jgi:hypothetical protein
MHAMGAGLLPCMAGIFEPYIAMSQDDLFYPPEHRFQKNSPMFERQKFLLTKTVKRK